MLMLRIENLVCILYCHNLILKLMWKNQQLSSQVAEAAEQNQNKENEEYRKYLHN